MTATKAGQLDLKMFRRPFLFISTALERVGDSDSGRPMLLAGRACYATDARVSGKVSRADW